MTTNIKPDVAMSRPVVVETLLVKHHPVRSKKNGIYNDQQADRHGQAVEKWVFLLAGRPKGLILLV